MLSRVAMTSGAVLLASGVFGVWHSALTPLALPAAVLTGAAFAAPMAAFAIRQDDDSMFSIVFRVGITPMFLFSGTFFPVATLPVALRWVAYATPLWHGADLCRGLVLGGAGALRSLGHLGYLGAWTLVGVVLARRSFERRLTR